MKQAKGGRQIAVAFPPAAHQQNAMFEEWVTAMENFCAYLYSVVHVMRMQHKEWSEKQIEQDLQQVHIPCAKAESQ
jgi:hypothetical protein